MNSCCWFLFVPCCIVFVQTQFCIRFCSNSNFAFIEIIACSIHLLFSWEKKPFYPWTCHRIWKTTPNSKTRNLAYFNYQNQTNYSPWQVSYVAGGLADVVIGSHVRRHLSQIYPLLLSLLPLSFVDHCGVQEPLARYACVGGHNLAIMAAAGLIGEET